MVHRYIIIAYRNNRYFPQTNSYKYASRSGRVTTQRSTYKELLIYRAWATCGMTFCHVKTSFKMFLQKELQTLEDAGDEIMLLDDDTAPIPYPFSLMPVRLLLNSLLGQAIDQF